MSGEGIDFSTVDWHWLLFWCLPVMIAAAWPLWYLAKRSLVPREMQPRFTSNRAIHDHLSQLSGASDPTPQFVYGFDVARPDVLVVYDQERETFL